MKDYKHLAQTIFKRKSVRVYSQASAEILEKNDIIQTLGIQPLIDNIKVDVKALGKGEVKNERSKYCIAFYSEEKPFYRENIGFIGQQIDLELQAMGLGTCWWGMKKPKRGHRKTDGLDCLITMTAGYPLKEETRIYPDGFVRKAVKDIVTGNIAELSSDRLIEAVRVAPSAVNLQPWLVEKTGNKYNFYLRSPKGIIERMISDIRHVDMGIALAHLFIQAKADGKDVSFSFEGKNIKQGKYIASIIT
ncbi:MAG: hypothetical protein LBI28_06215 [Treponema sp.]|jgi:hypothetical protein|nr:hypothetical protein [Treponema sp.]